MDLGKLDLVAASERGIKVAIKFPGSATKPLVDENGTQIVFDMFGKQSAAWVNASKAIQAEFAEVEGIPTDEAIQQGVRRVLAAAVRSWQGNIELNGEALTPSPDNAYALFKGEGFIWLVDQLLAATGNIELLFLEQTNG